MIKTMNWGKGIVFGMAAFVIFIVGMCVYMVSSPTDSFDHEYYEKGLDFDHDFSREQQVVKDHAQPIIQLGADKIEFTFAQPAKGTIKFMRPSSTSSDKIYQINSAQAEIPITSLAAGDWQLVFEWTSNKKAYLYQKEIYIK